MFTLFKKKTLRCPSCWKRGGLRPFEKTIDGDGNLSEVTICSHCTAIIHSSSLNEVQHNPGSLAQKQNDEGYFQFYNQNEYIKDDIIREIDLREDILDYFFSKTGGHFKNKKFLEIGAGSGFLAIKACQFFEKVFVFDLTLDLIKHSLSKIGIIPNLYLFDKFDELNEKFDVICLWHCIEHMPDANLVVRKLNKLTKKGGYIFFQTPLYRIQYLKNCHYFFLGAHSVRILLENCGYKLLICDFDTENSFMTCIAQKRG